MDGYHHDLHCICICMYINQYMQLASIHTYMHTYVHIHTYIIHIYIHINIRSTYIHIYIHTYIHTYIHKEGHASWPCGLIPFLHRLLSLTVDVRCDYCSQKVNDENTTPTRTKAMEWFRVWRDVRSICMNANYIASLQGGGKSIQLTPKPSSSKSDAKDPSLLLMGGPAPNNTITDLL